MVTTKSSGDRQNPIDLAGRRALVTGAAAGIGEAVARRLARAGVDLTIADIDEQGPQRLADELGGKVWGVDLSRPDEVADLELDVDILVNNAGVQHVARIEDFEVERFEFIVRLMLTAPFVLTRAVLPAMYDRGWGRIVHISSVHGRRARPFKSAYVSAKHGLEGLSKVIALEGANRGVTSNCVCPGYVRTGLVERQIADQTRENVVPEDKIISDILLARSPIKRLLEPAEVAEAVAFLCSPAAASITGTDITMDGGWAAR